MATGDLKRSLRKLEKVLRLLNYPKEVDYVGLMKGDTAAALPIISYSLTSYSPYVTEYLMECNVELIAKNDVRFIDTVYKLLRDQFDHKPILTKKQFLQHGFAEWKIQIICDILNCVIKKHKELCGANKTPSQPRKKISQNHSEPSSSNEKTPAEPVSIDVTGRFMTSGKKKALVIRHMYKENGINLPEDTESSVVEDNEVCDVSELKASEIVIREVQHPATKSEEEDIKSYPEITALQTMVAECQEKLCKLAWIEKRLDCLEERMKGKVIVDEKTWTNLLSRITLLETELLLSKKDKCVEFNAVSDDCASCSDVDLHPAGLAAAAAGTPRLPSKRRIPVSQPGMADPHQLFDDTSSAQSRGYGAQRAAGGLGYPASSASPQAAFLADPVSNMAMAYGSSLAAHGKELVDKNIDRFIPVTKLKYYFAVDTMYVGKKLGLLVFPYLHQDWEVQYQQDTPVAPRFDVNAPDLYIPAMAFITYILVAGLALGTQDRFSPDLLGLQASSALAWLALEVLAILLSLYLVTINTDLTTIDLVAFLGYKYVGMIGGVLMGLLFGKTGYYLVLGWCCVSIFVFMIRTLRLKILAEAAAEGVPVRGARNQLRMYLTMAVAAAQPLFMYWLTFHLVR